MQSLITAKLTHLQIVMNMLTPESNPHTGQFQCGG